MIFDFDVAIIGGGPVGSTLAYNLAKNNVSVCIIEKKKIIGYPLQCAGILSKDILDINELPSDLILNEVKGSYLSSPNKLLKVEKDSTAAFIIDRVAYDQFLSKHAKDNNVKLFMQHKVLNIDIDKGIIETNRGNITSKIIVGADGCNSIVSKKLNNVSKCYNANQYLVKINQDFNQEYVDIFINEEVLPGFLWFIPVCDNLYRIGLFSNKDYKKQNAIIDDFLESQGIFKNSNLNISDYEVLEKYRGYIPIYDKNKTIVNKRALLIGDAASQVKPTTGGGLILSFNTVNILSDIIVEALIKDDLNILNKYPKKFNKLFNDELNNEMKVHKTLNSLSNKDLDYLFDKVKLNNGEEFISKYGDMDKQSLLVKEFLKTGLLFKILPTLLKSKISNIWN
ncbi:NAD(P)/FAD-dependent oxidoreductase [Methanobrevibacter sp. 87.7]|uniref:geranylgeranyl reductase family protein n=1 Tax=Methanobrevibacter sp. 87.7 TaxID=387957 RepID=UPI000B505676|nr:NAD(P)/FAD-dependent oxidoreductase [Methanobrevibacter sp. 87.7]